MHWSSHPDKSVNNVWRRGNPVQRTFGRHLKQALSLLWKLKISNNFTSKRRFPPSLGRRGSRTDRRVTHKPHWGGSRENLTPINLGIVIRHDFPRLKIDDHHHVSAAQLKPICSILGKLRFMDACFFLWEGFLEWVGLSFVHHSVQWGKWNALVLSELLDKMDRGPLECGATWLFNIRLL